MSATIDRFDGEYEFLSSFHSAPVRFEGMRFPTVEHAYQAAKTSSHEERIAIQACPTPGRAKRMGRRVSVRDDWNDVKIVVMDEPTSSLTPNEVALLFAVIFAFTLVQFQRNRQSSVYEN